MKFIGQSIPYRNTCILCQLLYDLLPISAVLNTVKHPAEYSCRIFDALLLTDLGARRIQISHMHTQIMRCHLKRATGSGAGLFKDQGNILAL